MSRKKSLSDAFEAMTGQSFDSSARAIDAELFGKISSVDAHRMTATPIPIFDIYPDPVQPRRTIPHAIRHGWTGDPRQLDRVFAEWVRVVETERDGRKFDLERYVLSDEEVERTEFSGPLEESLMALVELALSIRVEGLTNPITVAPRALKYQIETGERRWLAYHLLFNLTHDERYNRIAARTVDESSIWRQAAENNARQNLNAIARARQFAMLLMDLLGTEKQISFRPLNEFESEQAYYAQVADGTDKALRVPRNTSERLFAATGLKHKNQVSNYRRLLELPPLVWQIADDLNWTEYYLRDLRDTSADEETFVARAVDAAVKAGYKSPISDVYLRQQPQRNLAGQSTETDPGPGTRQFYSQLTRLLPKTGPGRSKINQAAVEMIQQLREWLDEQEAIIENFPPE